MMVSYVFIKIQAENGGNIMSKKYYPIEDAAYCEAKRPDLRSKTVAFRF